MADKGTVVEGVTERGHRQPAPNLTIKLTGHTPRFSLPSGNRSDASIPEK